MPHPDKLDDGGRVRDVGELAGFADEPRAQSPRGVSRARGTHVTESEVRALGVVSFSVVGDARAEGTRHA